MAKRVDSVKRPWVQERKAFERNVSSNSNFYNSRTWRKFRATFLEKNPLCVECEAEGVVTVANVVDHIIPINAGGAELDESNMQSLCITHHNKKSARESKGYGG